MAGTLKDSQTEGLAVQLIADEGLMLTSIMTLLVIGVFLTFWHEYRLYKTLDNESDSDRNL